MSKSNHLQIRVDEEFKSLLKKAAKAHGFDSVSGLMIHLGNYAISQVVDLPEDERKPIEKKGRYVGVRINDIEGKAIAKIVEKEGFKNPSEFFLTLIRQRLTNLPRLKASDVDSLEDAKFQLMAIGRNLNQMVRAIHDGKADAARFSEHYAEQIIDRITALKSEINNLVKVSTARDL
jgi:hypothetical protein